MRVCLKCQAFYDDDNVKFCLNDGVPLLNMDQTHGLWEKGAEAVRQTRQVVSRQIRKQKLTRIVSTTVTTVLTVMVVSVMALNSYVYLNPETQPPIVPMTLLPSTVPGGEEPSSTTPAETLPGGTDPEGPDETNPPDPGTNTAVTQPGGPGGGVTPGNTNPHGPGTNTNVNSTGNTNPFDPGTNTNVRSSGTNPHDPGTNTNVRSSGTNPHDPGTNTNVRSSGTNPCSDSPPGHPAPMCVTGPKVIRKAPTRDSNSNQQEIDRPNPGPKKPPSERKIRGPY